MSSDVTSLMEKRHGSLLITQMKRQIDLRPNRPHYKRRRDNITLIDAGLKPDRIANNPFQPDPGINLISRCNEYTCNPYNSKDIKQLLRRCRRIFRLAGHCINMRLTCASRTEISRTDISRTEVSRAAVYCAAVVRRAVTAIRHRPALQTMI